MVRSTPFSRRGRHLAFSVRQCRKIFSGLPAIEQAYYRKSGIYPLMHAVGIRNSLIETHPNLPAAICDGFLKANELAIADLERLSTFAITLC